MKRLVRNKLTRAFLKTDGGWAADFHSAENFADVKSVMEACQSHGLANVELVLVMGSEPSAYYDIALPLTSSS
jgi:hypothetical protein